MGSAGEPRSGCMHCPGEQLLAFPACGNGMGSNHLLCPNTSCISFQWEQHISLLFFVWRDSTVAACCMNKMPANVCAKWTLQLMLTSTLGAAFPSLWMAYLRNFCCGFKSVWQKDNFGMGFASWRWDCTQVCQAHWSSIACSNRVQVRSSPVLGKQWGWGGSLDHGPANTSVILSKAWARMWES